jgi:hypothetical protein
MSNEHDGEHSRTRGLRQRWDEEDAAREERERRQKELFLEEQANEIFTPIDACLTRIDKVLRGFDASLENDRTWQHLDNQRLRRVAKVKSNQPGQQLALEFTIDGTKIFHREKLYQGSRDTEALIRIIIGEVEQFLRPR